MRGDCWLSTRAHNPGYVGSIPTPVTKGETMETYYARFKSEEKLSDTSFVDEGVIIVKANSRTDAYNKAIKRLLDNLYNVKTLDLIQLTDSVIVHTNEA